MVNNNEVADDDFDMYEAETNTKLLGNDLVGNRDRALSDGGDKKR